MAPSHKINFEMRKIIERKLLIGASAREISIGLGVSPSAITHETRKGRKNGVYSAEYAQAETDKNAARSGKTGGFSDSKKAFLTDLAVKGRSMLTMSQRVGSTPRKVYEFLKEVGLTAGYEAWEGWTIGVKRTCREIEKKPLPPGEARLQTQINALKESVETISMQIEILSEQLKQRS